MRECIPANPKENALHKAGHFYFSVARGGIDQGIRMFSH